MKENNKTINIIPWSVPADKTVKTSEDVFRAARQIAYNFYTIILKKDPKLFYSEKKYEIRLLK